MTSGDIYNEKISPSAVEVDLSGKVKKIMMENDQTAAAMVDKKNINDLLRSYFSAPRKTVNPDNSVSTETIITKIAISSILQQPPFD